MIFSKCFPVVESWTYIFWGRVARYFDLRPVEAAKKLADDFGISYGEKTYTPSRTRPNPKISAELEAKKKELQCYRTLCDYLHHLQQWKTNYAPEHPYEEYHPLFVEALQNISYVEYILDDVFLNGGAGDKAAFIREHGDDVLALDKRLQSLAVEIERIPQRSLAI